MPSDWFPTFMALATDNQWSAERANLPNELDGINVWGALTAVGGVSPRTTLIHGSTVGGAIRRDSFKLIVAQRDVGWTPVPDSAEVFAKDANGELVNGSTFRYVSSVRGGAEEGCGCTTGNRSVKTPLRNRESARGHWWVASFPHQWLRRWGGDKASNLTATS